MLKKTLRLPRRPAPRGIKFFQHNNPCLSPVIKSLILAGNDGFSSKSVANLRLSVGRYFFRDSVRSSLFCVHLFFARRQHTPPRPMRIIIMEFLNKTQRESERVSGRVSVRNCLATCKRGLPLCQVSLGPGRPGRFEANLEARQLRSQF